MYTHTVQLVSTFRCVRDAIVSLFFDLSREKKNNKNPRILVLLKHLVEDASYLPRTTNIVFGFPISAFIRLIDIYNQHYICSSNNIV